MSGRGAVVLCAAGVLAGTAGTACPVAADMAGGVRLELANGDSEVFRRTGAATVESVLTVGGAEQTRFSYARGVYLLESIEMEGGALVPGSRATFAFPTRPEGTPEPAPGHGWGLRIVATYGGDPVAEMLGIRFGEPGEATIGDCTLEMLPVEQRIYEDGELVAREERNYIPALGFSYALAWHEDDRVDRYDYVNIEAVE
ncbi:hypothetical protein [Vannielia litorea]|uniref:hypothetical protein n=1 Tax=Vannielia litorea TaxID=1217970 RepID=UPI001C943218|nr:hypothetical protein [Vannielia litorea]MBY6048229.1 hypothetical protein [Vannielia litorea]MBY6075643.1 hypothetical protein [Vannielia litorea]